MTSVPLQSNAGECCQTSSDSSTGNHCSKLCLWECYIKLLTKQFSSAHRLLHLQIHVLHLFIKARVGKDINHWHLLNIYMNPSSERKDLIKDTWRYHTFIYSPSPLNTTWKRGTIGRSTKLSSWLTRASFTILYPEINTILSLPLLKLNTGPYSLASCISK